MNTALLVVLLSFGTLTLTAIGFGVIALVVTDVAARFAKYQAPADARLDHSGMRARPGAALEADKRRRAA